MSVSKPLVNRDNNTKELIRAAHCADEGDRARMSKIEQNRLLSLIVGSDCFSSKVRREAMRELKLNLLLDRLHQEAAIEVLEGCLNANAA